MSSGKSPSGVAQDASSSDSDTADFIATEDLLANSYDDESTIAEAEADEVQDAQEIDNLKKESEMPLEQLLLLYGRPPVPSSGSKSGPPQSRLRKRNHAGLLVPTPAASEAGPASNPVKPEGGSADGEPETSQTVAAIEMEGEGSDEDDEDFEEEDDESASESEGEEDESGGEEGGIKEEDDKESMNASAYSAGSRLWCRALAPSSVLGSTGSYDSDDDDEDYDPRHDASQHWKGTIRIGDSFQASVPPCLPSNSPDPPCSDSRLLWEPEKLSEDVVIDFIRKYAASLQIRLPKCRTPDDEEALFWLMQSDYNSMEALRRIKNKAVTPSDIPAYVHSWSENECTAFERGFALHNKNFYHIRDTKLRCKTVGEIVQFYYVWKKTARHDEFMRMYRKDKKKHHIHPGITDYMDCLALEQDSIGVNYMLDSQSLPNNAQDEEWITRGAPGSWCPVRTSLGQAEVDKLVGEAAADVQQGSGQSSVKDDTPASGGTNQNHSLANGSSV